MVCSNTCKLMVHTNKNLAESSPLTTKLKIMGIFLITLFVQFNFGTDSISFGLQDLNTLYGKNRIKTIRLKFLLAFI